MTPLDLVRLRPLMERTGGDPGIAVGLIDGPVALGHAGLAGAEIHEVPGAPSTVCARSDSAACRHGTFVAGILAGRRNETAPAICPGCTLLVRPVFAEIDGSNGEMLSTTPEALAAAIVDTVRAGARVVNVSAAIGLPSSRREQDLEAALNSAMRRGVLIVAAAGNQGVVGSSAITRHPWVIPVTACDRQGRPMVQSNLGGSIRRSGLAAPGDGVARLDAGGGTITLHGTSAAAPFVTGAIALLWSLVPQASAAAIRGALLMAEGMRRSALAPPLLDAWTAYQSLTATPARAAGCGC